MRDVLVGGGDLISAVCDGKVFPETGTLTRGHLVIQLFIEGLLCARHCGGKERELWVLRAWRPVKVCAVGVWVLI